MDPLSISQNFNSRMEESQQEEDDNTIVCSICDPVQTFATFNEKVLHDYNQHSGEKTIYDTNFTKEVTRNNEIKNLRSNIEAKKRIKVEWSFNKLKRYSDIINSSSKSRPSKPPSKRAKYKYSRRHPHINPVFDPYQCDQCDFFTYYKMNIIKHVTNKHQLVPPPHRILPVNPLDRVCLVCGQTFDRKQSLRSHYLKLHGNLLEISSLSELNVDFIQNKLQELKERGLWIEPTRVLPVKRTKKYRHKEWSDDSGEDTEDYYQGYHGPMAISVAYHSSSDEYEEAFITTSSMEEHKCTICGRVMKLKKSLNAHMKKHLIEETIEYDDGSEDMKFDDGSSIVIEETEIIYESVDSV